MTVLRRRTRSFDHGEPEPLDLGETNLSGAILQEANLSRADLWEANLSRADLLGAKNFTQAQLETTSSGDSNTQLPPHLKPPEHWGVKTDERAEEY